MAASVTVSPSNASVLTEPPEPQALSGSVSQPAGQTLGAGGLEPDLHPQSKAIMGLQQATWPAPFMNHLITRALW